MTHPPRLLVGHDTLAIENALSKLLEGVPLAGRFIYGLKEVITIDEVRQVLHWASLTPGDELQAFVIWNADRMKKEAANALLKILEEPPSSTIFILVASALVGIPATLRSRLFIEQVGGNEATTSQLEGDREEALQVLEEELVRLRREYRAYIRDGSQEKATVLNKRIAQCLEASELLTSSSVAPKYIMDLYALGE